MGSEALCSVTWKGQRSEGKALLETDEIVFRGDFRFRIAFKDVTTAEARGARLHVETAEGEAVFELGPTAARWAEKIRKPKPLLDKLGVTAESKVSVIGVSDVGFEEELAARGADVSRRARKDSDLVFYGVEALADLDRLASLRESIKPNGAIWVVHPKGRKDLRDVDVIAAAKRAGLTDNKVARFSATHSALRLVIPAADRPRA